MVRLIEKHPVLALTVCVLLMLLPNLDALPVSIMEARNFITAREMVTDGHWLLTSMNGEARYEKPPLPTWITAVFGIFSGTKSVFAMRFPTVLMVLLLGVFTFKFVFRTSKNKAHSLATGLITVTSFYVIGICIEAPWDIFAHTFMLLGIYYLYLLMEHKASLSALILASLLLGLSFLSKGPVSLYALLLPFLIAYFIIYRIDRKKLLYVFLILIMSLLIGGWWYLFVRWADPQTFMDVAQKETGNWSRYNVRPFYYYWSFFTQSGLWTILAFAGFFYPFLKDKVSNKKAYQFSFLWTIFSVVLLSLIPEKKSRYLMPVLIPLAINTGFYVQYLFHEFKTTSSLWPKIPVYFHFGLLGSIGIVFPLFVYFVLGESLQGHWNQFGMASLVMVLFGVLMIRNLVRHHIKKTFYLSVLFFMGLMIFALPLGRALEKNPHFKSISKLNTSYAHPIYADGPLAPEMIWDYGNKIPMIEPGQINAKKFGLLSQKNIQELDEIYKDYNIISLSLFDLNTVPKDHKRYKSRLTSGFYQLVKS